MLFYKKTQTFSKSLFKGKDLNVGHCHIFKYNFLIVLFLSLLIPAYHHPSRVSVSEGPG